MACPARARDSDFTSPVMRSPLRIHTESVFCASAAAAPSRSTRLPSSARAKALEAKEDIAITFAGRGCPDK